MRAKGPSTYITPNVGQEREQHWVRLSFALLVVHLFAVCGCPCKPQTCEEFRELRATTGTTIGVGFPCGILNDCTKDPSDILECKDTEDQPDGELASGEAFECRSLSSPEVQVLTGGGQSKAVRVTHRWCKSVQTPTSDQCSPMGGASCRWDNGCGEQRDCSDVDGFCCDAQGVWRTQPTAADCPTPVLGSSCGGLPSSCDPQTSAITCPSPILVNNTRFVCGSGGVWCAGIVASELASFCSDVRVGDACILDNGCESEACQNRDGACCDAGVWANLPSISDCPAPVDGAPCQGIEIQRCKSTYLCEQFIVDEFFCSRDTGLWTPLPKRSEARVLVESEYCGYNAAPSTVPRQCRLNAACDPDAGNASCPCRKAREQNCRTNAYGSDLGCELKDSYIPTICL